MTKETVAAWKEFERLLKEVLNKMAISHWEKYRNNRAIRKAYKHINKGIGYLQKFEKILSKEG